MITEIIKNDSNRKNITYLLILILISISIRLFFLPFELPFKHDAIGYFAFAFEISKTHQFPAGILITNDGWSLFLSPIFSIIGQSDMMNLINAQRITSIVLSSITILPVFLLCKKFVSSKHALIGAALFGFSHKLIENSILGVTESLFIFLISFVLLFSLSQNSKNYIFSFIFLGLAIIVRYEAILFLIPLIIIFFIKFRKEKFSYLKLSIFIFVLILILLPITALRIESNGVDGIISHTFSNPQIANPNTYSSLSSENLKELSLETDKKVDADHHVLQSQSGFIANSFTNTLKFLGLVLIPLFIFFIPFGIYNLVKTKNKDISYLLIFSVFLILPAMYAYGREIQDTRYLYVLFPIFCVISVYGFDIIRKLQKNRILLLIITLIILSSVILLVSDKNDYASDNEIFQITKFLVQNAKGVNDSPDILYLRIATLEKIWPNSLPLDDHLTSHPKTSSFLKKIPSQNFNSLEDYLTKSKNSNLTHIVLSKNNNSAFLDELLINYEKYTYLEKVFDSEDYNFKNEIIILKINYSNFENQI